MSEEVNEEKNEMSKEKIEEIKEELEKSNIIDINENLNENLDEELQEEFGDKEVTEGDKKGAEATVFLGYQWYNYSTLGKIKIKFPSMQEEMEINRFYSSIFTKMLTSSDLLPMRKMIRMLEEKGIWSKVDDERMDALKEEYISCKTTINQILTEKQRKTKIDKKNLEDLNKQAITAYKEFIDLNIQKGVLFENTVERKAEEEMIRYKMVKCVMKEDETPLWKNYDEILAQQDSPDLEQLTQDCLAFWRGISIPLSGN